jgi:hypothetical protein
VQVLQNWRLTLEEEASKLQKDIQHKAQYEHATVNLVGGNQTITNSPQLNLLLQESTTLMDQIKEMRQLRLDAIVRGDMGQALEIEHAMTKALSRLHAVAGARQFWYASQSNSLPFLQVEYPVQDQLQSLLRQYETVFQDTDLVEGQLKTAIDSNIGGLEIFGILKCQQECEQIVKEIKTKLLQFTRQHFKQLETELTLLNNELSILHTELIAELSRRNVSDDIKGQIGEWMEALRAESDHMIAKRNKQFTKFIRMGKSVISSLKEIEEVEKEVSTKTKAPTKATSKPKSKTTTKPKSKTTTKPKSKTTTNK